MVSVEAAGTSVEDPFPDVLGGDSSPDASKVSPQGGQSLTLAIEVPGPGARRIVAQVPEEEEDMPDAAWLAVSVTFPFTSVRVSCLLLYLVYVFFFPMLCLPECFILFP
jgi:hypothetical protein